LFTGTGVDIVDSYYSGNLEVPRVAIVGGDIGSTLHELGGAERYDRVWWLEIYASTKQQRDEIGYRIFGQLREDGHIPVQDYDEGFPPTVSPSSLGYMDVVKHQYRPKNYDTELQSLMDWRATVAIHSRYIV
jgi:hypothetical protein